jgi:hypothetical protein
MLKFFRKHSGPSYYLIVGIEEEVYCPVSYVRIVNHLQHMPAGWIGPLFVLPKDALAAAQELKKASCLLLARTSSSESAFLAAQARRAGLPVVYDIDDYLWKLPDYLAAKDLATGVDAVLAHATLVTSPSEALRTFIQGRFPGLPVRIVPNAADVFCDHPPLRHVRAVMANSDFFRLRDMKREFFQALRDGARDADVKLYLYYLSNDAPETCTDDPHLQVIWCGVRSYSSYRTLLSTIEPQIALVPLPDDHFSQYKSVVKFAEYGYHGIAAIYSGVDPYRSFVRDGVDGWLTANTQAEWRAAVRYVLSLAPEELDSARRQASERSRREFGGSQVRSAFFSALESTGMRTVARAQALQPPPAQAEFVFREAYDYMVGRCSALESDIYRLRKFDPNSK